MPISDCEVRDPRMRRTREALHAALRNLMQSKGFDAISVHDIAEAAAVNRATFYDHYSDKFALLDAMVAGGFHRMLEDRKVRFDGTCASAAAPVILAACDYLAECHSGPSECRQQSAFEPLMDAAVTSAIFRVLLDGMRARVSPGGASPDMVATAASWAIYGAVKAWYKIPGRPPAEEAAQAILKLVLPILQNACPAAAGAR
jgi:AcrR family transcriptional regulator